jgi:AcrR family transcriptional regulator
MAAPNVNSALRSLAERALKYYTVRMVEKLERRPSRKQDLIKAAVRVVLDDGVAGLTIDAVARQAGVTKGGVQYHFASKDQLITELLTDALSAMDQALEEVVSADPTAGAWHRAYVGLILWGLSDYDRCVAALMTSLGPGDPLGRPYDTMAAHWRQRAGADGIDPAMSLVVRFAADGLWLERAYGGASDKEVELVRAKLFALIDGAVT